MVWKMRQTAASVPQIAPLEEAHHHPLGFVQTDGLGTIAHSHGSCAFNPTLDVWSDAKTQANTLKAMRVLKLHAMRQNAKFSNMFLGVGSTTVSMVFSLKKFPPSLKALQVLLPHPLAHPCEGLFVKTARGKKVLSVPFGTGSMEEHALVENAMAITSAFRKSLDSRLVREIMVAVERLELPIWNQKLFSRLNKKMSTKSSLHRHSDSKRGFMMPPVCPPLKKAKVS
jgi:hypothetical protein